MGRGDDEIEGQYVEADDYLPAGTIIANRYEIIKPLGSGGMGSVYRVRDSVLDGEETAMKILHGEFAHDKTHTQRFLREVQLMRRINHKNVVRTFDVGADNDTVYFTMELVNGRSLADILDNHQFKSKDTPSFIIQVCEALEAIHAASIVHRDLKPGNIIITDDGTVKITDFGVARPEVSDLTAHNEIVGSATYMAPEIWLGKKLTGSIDLYSLGIILYEIATGDVPFIAESPAALMRLHLERAPTPPLELNQHCAPWLNRLVIKLLAKSPKERPASGREVVNTIIKYTNQRGDYENDLLGSSQSGVSNSFIDKLELMSKIATDSSDSLKSVKPPADDGTKKFSNKSKSKFKSKFELPAKTAVLETAKNFGVSLGACFAIALVFGVLVDAIVSPPASFVNQVLLIQNGEIPNPIASTGDVISYGIPVNIIFLALLTLPLTIVSGAAGGLIGVWHGIKNSLIYFGAISVCVFVTHLQPVLKDAKLDGMSLISAGLATRDQLLDIALLSPVSAIFQQELFSSGLLKYSVGFVSILESPLSLLLLALYGFVVYKTVAKTLSVKKQYKGKSLMICTVVAGAFIIIESLIVSSFALDIADRASTAVLLCSIINIGWLALATMYIAATTHSSK